MAETAQEVKVKYTITMVRLLNPKEWEVTTAEEAILKLRKYLLGDALYVVEDAMCNPNDILTVELLK